MDSINSLISSRISFEKLEKSPRDKCIISSNPIHPISRHVSLSLSLSIRQVENLSASEPVSATSFRLIIINPRRLAARVTDGFSFIWRATWRVINWRPIIETGHTTGFFNVDSRDGRRLLVAVSSCNPLFLRSQTLDEWSGMESVNVCVQLDRIYASRENVDNIVEREERKRDREKNKSFWIGWHVEFSGEWEAEKKYRGGSW